MNSPVRSPETEPAREDRRRNTADRLPSFLTVDEVAAFLRVNRKTLYEAIRLNQVRGAVRFGKVIRLSREALLRWALGSGRPGGD